MVFRNLILCPKRVILEDRPLLVNQTMSVIFNVMLTFLRKFLFFVNTQMRSKGVLDAFNTEALKLAIMGVTIVVASGRNGAAGGEELCEVSSGSAGGAPYWTV